MRATQESRNAMAEVAAISPVVEGQEVDQSQVGLELENQMDRRGGLRLV